jgi:hypothetical protein
MAETAPSPPTTTPPSPGGNASIRRPGWMRDLPGGIRVSGGWLAINVLLPLVPFVVGALIRAVYADKLERQLFDPAEFSISMAVLCLLVLGAINRLDDRHTKGMWSAVFIWLAVFFVAIFALGTGWKFELDQQLLALHETVRGVAARQAASTVDFESASQAVRLEWTSRRLDSLRTGSVLLGGLTVFLSLVCKHRYKLEDW